MYRKEKTMLWQQKKLYVRTKREMINHVDEICLVLHIKEIQVDKHMFHCLKTLCLELKKTFMS